MKAAGGGTPSISPSPFGNVDDVASEMDKPLTRQVLEKAKRECLERDDYRCAITGLYAKEAIGEFSNVSNDDIRATMAQVHISHIIPFSLGSWKNEAEVSVSFSVALYT